MSIGLKRIQVHLCGFSSSQIWNIAWHDWCSLGRIDAQYSVPQVATGNDEDYKQCWCCFYGSTTDWIPLQNWLCRGPGRWLNGRLTKAILPVGMGGGSKYSRQGRSGRRIEAANANLSPCPRSLHDLWTEYIQGLGGRQPASQFSHGERGKSNHRYFCRNVIWKKMVQKMETGDWRAM
jgi:hypothetical protein